MLEGVAAGAFSSQHAPSSELRFPSSCLVVVAAESPVWQRGAALSINGNAGRAPSVTQARPPHR